LHGAALRVTGRKHRMTVTLKPLGDLLAIVTN
jgi:hypothetical protein